jgi:GTPase SAR1 family protein
MNWEPCKISIIGELGVDKEDFITQYIEKTFPELSRQFYVSNVYEFEENVPFTFKNKQKYIKLTIWNIPDFEKENLKLRIDGYNNTNVFILLFNLCDKNSLNILLNTWYAELKEYNPNASILLASTSNGFNTEVITKMDAMQIGIQLNAFDLIDFTLKDPSSIYAVFSRCFEQFYERRTISPMGIFKRKKKSVLIEKKELEQTQNRRRSKSTNSGSLSPISVSEKDSTESPRVIKLQNDIKILFTIVEKLTRESDAQKKEIEELKRLLT